MAHMRACHINTMDWCSKAQQWSVFTAERWQSRHQVVSNIAMTDPSAKHVLPFSHTKYVIVCPVSTPREHPKHNTVSHGKPYLG